MWEQFSDVGQHEDRVIDDTDLGPEAAAEMIWKVVNKQNSQSYVAANMNPAVRANENRCRPCP